MRCPECGADLDRGTEGTKDDRRNAYLRTQDCEKCGSRRVSVDHLFPEDRQAEELHYLYALRYARRAKKVRSTQHT